MTTSTIRAALDTFQQAANRGTAVYLSLELVQELRDALKAKPEPEGEGPTLDHVNLIGFALGREPWATWLRKGGCLESAHCELSDLMLAAITRWGAPVVEPATPPAPEQGDAWWHELINEIARVQHVAQGEGQGPRFDLAEAVARWCRPPAPESGGQPVSQPYRLAEPGKAKKLHPLWYLIEFLEGHSSFLRRTEPTDELAEILSNSATLLQQQATELAALREERFVAGQNRINQLWVDALDPSTQVPLSAPQIKKLRTVLDDHCDQGPPNGTMWKSQELEELMWAVEGWVSAATPLPAPPPGEAQPPHPTFLDAIRLAQGCHDYSGGHSGPLGEAFQDGVGTVVTVLKKAAGKPWDFQTLAVFGVGSAPQAGEGEA